MIFLILVEIVLEIQVKSQMIQYDNNNYKKTIKKFYKQLKIHREFI